ncbi:MAG TPA: deoxyribose-phosphate aldolase, partial [Arthrobacter sp.]|nr:deoxyribose-phosphate aldolase [Arthrobacter sp.]
MSNEAAATAGSATPAAPDSGITAGAGPSATIATYIDHTLLKPEASEAEILKVCAEAVDYRFKSVCVNPVWVKTVKTALKGSGVLTCSVVGFPLGATPSDVKAFEARGAVLDGAEEVDMVINIAAARANDKGAL